MRTIGWLFVMLLVTISGMTVAQDSVPRFEAVDECWMNDLPEETAIECGYVVVPEDRSNPDSPTIQIAVAILRSESADPLPDPVIYLEGGPGGSALEFLALTLDRYTPYLDNRDVIVFDQRGVGLSTPALDCPEDTAFRRDNLDRDFSVDEYVAEYSAALTACGERLAEEGINLDAYTSAENASDVAAIAAALGYEQLNLFGISYGTKLALTVLRDHPEVVRSAIIDSVYPPQVVLNDTPLQFERSLNILFADCAADADCNAAFPDLEQVFYDTLAQLDAEPARFEATDAANLRQVDVVMDGPTFAGLIFQSLYATDLLGAIPEAIYQTRDGNYDFASLFTSAILFQIDAISSGMNMAVQCNEEYPFDTPESIDATLATVNPALVDFSRYSLVDPAVFTVCEAFGESDTVDARENEAVISDVPTLVMAGQYDPITPPEYAALAAETLSTSYMFTFPAMGHGVVPSAECPQGIALAFLEDPTSEPDSSCIAEMTAPDFITPTDAVITEYAFVDYAGEGFTMQVPDGWSEMAMMGIEAIARQQTALDQTALLVQALPGSGVELMMPLLAGQFGADPESAVEREVGDLSWQILQGETQGIGAILGLTEVDGQIYMLILTTDLEEQAALYDAVFLPVLDSFAVDGS
jgi:pimeloyl-ACP methyl ester carboxylesterase